MRPGAGARQPALPRVATNMSRQRWRSASATTATTANTATAVAAGSVGTAGLSAAVLSNTFWRLGGNAGSTPGTQYLSTTDNQPFELKVNGQRALRLEPHASSPNVIGGFSGNHVGPGVYGATIGGGGAGSFSNVVFASSATIAGGNSNNVGTDSFASVIGGGTGNVICADSSSATIAGGYRNQIATQSWSSAIGGGADNTIGPSSYYGAIAAGRANAIDDHSPYSTIGGGRDNAVSFRTPDATIAGGNRNSIGPDADYSAIGGGIRNLISFRSGGCTIGGGETNKILGAGKATIAGGQNNKVDEMGWGAALGGGHQNTVEGSFATIPGGDSNSATNYAFAAGRRAKAQHTGAFVWADSTDADFASTGAYQFLIRASGGVGIGGAPQDALLDIEGNARLNNNNLFLRHASDRNHGLGWYGYNYVTKPFAGVDVDGPVLYGYSGGVLGSTIGGQKVVVRWIADGRVGINTTNPAMSLHVASPSGPASVLIGQNHEGGGYTALAMGVSAVTDGHAYLQAIRAAGTSFGDLGLNPSGGNVGIGTTAPAQKLHVAGRIRMGTWTGDGTIAVYRNASGDLGMQSSDRRLKQNVAPITNALAVVRCLTGVTFNWRGEPADAGKTVGLIAQDVQAVLPELTFETQGEDGETYLGVHYEKVAVVLANAVNELNQDFAAKLERKDAEIQELTQRLARLERFLGQHAK